LNHSPVLGGVGDRKAAGHILEKLSQYCRRYFVLFVWFVLIFLVGDSWPWVPRHNASSCLVYLLKDNDIDIVNQAANILKELSQHGRRWFAFIRVVVTFPVDDWRAAILQLNILSCLHDIFKVRNANIQSRQAWTLMENVEKRSSVDARTRRAAVHILETLSKYGRR
jgi:hypothetical protein